MERRRILERTQDGRSRARAALEATGRTHRGKASLGRPKAAAAASVVLWRRQTGASHQADGREVRALRGNGEAVLRGSVVRTGHCGESSGLIEGRHSTE